MSFLLGALVFLVVALSGLAVYTRDLVRAIVLLAISDVLLGVVFYLLSAPDIAITQMAVVGGLSSLVLAYGVGKTRRVERE